MEQLTLLDDVPAVSVRAAYVSGLVWSVAHVAVMLDVSPQRVRQLIAAGKLDALRQGRAWLVVADSVQAYAAQKGGVSK